MTGNFDPVTLEILWRRFGVLLRGIVRQKREDVHYPQRVLDILQF